MYELNYRKTKMSQLDLPVNVKYSENVTRYSKSDRLIFVAGLGVGLIGIIGLIRNAEGANTSLYQMAGFVFAALLLSFVSISWVGSWSRTSVGIFMLAHVIAAATSGYVSSSPIEAIIRYVLLLPALSMMLGVAEMGPSSIASMRMGLTLAAFIVIVYSLTKLDISRLTNPKYRGSQSDLNPNTLGYYSAICGISFLDFAIARIRVMGSRKKLLTCFYLASVIICMISILATKSRTAALAFVVGAAVELVITLGVKKAVLLLIGGVAAVIMAAPGFLAFGGKWVSTVFEFNDKNRSLSTGTGRFELWEITISRIWLPHWILGVGPGLHVSVGQLWDTNYISAHNALLVNLAETGIVGVIPLVLILAVCARATIPLSQDPVRRFAVAIFVAALAESSFEPTLFSIGNAGGFLVLLSIAVLGRSRYDMELQRQYVEYAAASESPGV